MSGDFNAMVLAALADLKQDMGLVHNEVRGQIGLLRGEIGSLQGEIGALRDELRGEIGSLQRELGALRDELRGEIGALRADLISTRADIMERIDRLQNALTKTREDITVNMGAVDHVWRAFASERDAIEHLREAVTVLQRKVHRLEGEQPL